VPALSDIVRYTNEYLRIDEIADWPQALNGLQLENSGNVRKLGAAVDASMRTFTAAAESGIDLLLVHHGLFWAGLRPITGPLRRQLAFMFERDLALYSVHLPLDLHPELGNNARLARALGLVDPEPFLEMKGELVGLRSQTQIFPNELARKLEESLGGPVKLYSCGPATTANIGVITGGAGSENYAIAE
jgi:putative NIF3 family GTP cyclohydrolase 1 type 2